MDRDHIAQVSMACAGFYTWLVSAIAFSENVVAVKAKEAADLHRAAQAKIEEMNIVRARVAQLKNFH